MTGLETLLGAELIDKTGQLHPTAKKLAEADAVGIYFSAHWCPPCRGFTPELAKTYTGMKEAGKKFEIVFVSSDRDEDAFDEYLADQPWLAVPYSARDIKTKLSKKFKVSGIPTLVIVGGDGELITKEGRDAVSSDPEGAKFPWKPRSLQECLAELKSAVIGKADAEGVGTVATARELVEGKTLGLYFSAHWCGPCRSFTPELAATYKKVKAGPHADDFEIVFVSSDSDQEAFDEYYAEMPWLALPYPNRALKADLSKICEVEGIPTLVIVGPDGKVINHDGRMAIASDKTGQKFPWHPPPYAALEACAAINDSPTLVAFVEGLDDADTGDAESEVEKFAKKQIAAAVVAGAEPPELHVAIAKPGDGLAARLRTMMKLPAPTDESVLAIVDLQDEQSFYVAKLGGSTQLTADNLDAFAKAFASGELASERQTLEF